MKRSKGLELHERMKHSDARKAAKVKERRNEKESRDKERVRGHSE